jgi:hypothetical protein
MLDTVADCELVTMNARPRFLAIGRSLPRSCDGMAGEASASRLASAKTLSSAVMLLLSTRQVEARAAISRASVAPREQRSLGHRFVLLLSFHGDWAVSRPVARGSNR